MSAEKPSARRDLLASIEAKVQAQWAEAKPFEVDAPEQYDPENKEKYLVTFPYPYMNGVLHLGHAFTLGKAEFAARFQRLLGKRVLFPFGFHCTGTPIAACAQRLAREYVEFGNPPVFPEEDEAAEAAEAAKKAAAPKPKAKKKLAKKKSKKRYQYQIMLEMGVPEEEIHLFRDPRHWLQYFPPIGQQHLEKFGLAADFRRAFITTDVNPYYNRFIEWQFNTLRKRGVLSYGKRMSVFSPASGQVCADHDRASGEGVGPQEYTLILGELLAPFPPALKAVEGRSVKLAAATLRPETMYGQTNMWALPEGDYGAYEMKNGDVYVCSERSARNMSYQDMTEVRGEPKCLATFKGADLMGAACRAPLAKYETVYVLPLMTISMGKGTGIVTCVPSDAPDDYAALQDMRKKKALREKFGIADEKVLPFEVVPIIDIPGLGRSAAARLCEEQKVQSQNDRKKLDVIKAEVYKAGFYEGIMDVGPHKGKKVADAKPLVRQELIDAGDAAPYFEPENLIMSRNGDECVVAYVNQWSIAYGEESWKAKVKAHVDNVLETFNPVAKKMFQDTVDWLSHWACSREFGLGTRMPWDERYLVESLSDSTIYYGAYYAISNYLQSSLEGDKQGKANMTADQLTDEVFDYIFLGGDLPAAAPKEAVERMRSEFLYWMPLDLRVSGKDLIRNHLTMSMYTHAAVWEDQPEMMPRGFYTNGHILVDKEKMSKSTGNFITMVDAIKRYSCDATRLALAEGGDGLGDANFDSSFVNASILTLTKEIAFFTEMVEALKGMPKEAPSEPSFFDRVFMADMDQAIVEARAGYEGMLYHEALKHGFWGMISARDQYRAAVGEAVRRDVVERYLEAFVVMVSPVCPHVAQHLWEMIGRDGLVVDAKWPAASEPDAKLVAQAVYVRQAARNFRLMHQNASRPGKKGKKAAAINAAYVFYAERLPPLMQAVVDAYKAGAAANNLPSPKDVQKQLAAAGLLKVKKDTKNAMVFAAQLRKDYESKGDAAFGVELPFDEAALLRANADYLHRGIDSVKKVTVLDVYAADGPAEAAKASPSPGEPAFIFYQQE